MRQAGRVVANALQAVKSHAAVGISLQELDEVAAAAIADAGAKPAFLGYRPGWASVPFPGVICASVNDAIVHGIPGGYRIADGDLVSIDCGAFLDGWCGDAAISFIVGTPDPLDRQLIEATEQALARGIAAARPGKKWGTLPTALGEQPDGRDMGFSRTMAGTELVVPCTRSRTCPTMAGQAAGSN